METEQLISRKRRFKRDAITREVLLKELNNINVRKQEIKLLLNDKYEWYRFSGLIVTAIAGIINGIRVVIDGKVSFYGTILRILAFVATGLIYLFDPDLSLNAKASYGLPKLFAVFMAVVTLIGIIINDSEFYKSL